MAQPTSESLKAKIVRLEKELAERYEAGRATGELMAKRLAEARAERVVAENSARLAEARLAEARAEIDRLRDALARLEGYIHRVHEEEDATAEAVPAVLEPVTRRARRPVVPATAPRTIYSRRFDPRGFDDVAEARDAPSAAVMGA